MNGEYNRTFGIWARFDSEASKKKRPEQRSFRWVVDAVIPALLLTLTGMIVFLPQTLSIDARMTLFIFSAAVIFWTTTDFNAAFVSLTAVMALIVTGTTPQKDLFDALASDVIWLIIGSFIMSAALIKTGLVFRMVNHILLRAKTIGDVFWLLTITLVILSFFIPSTSARAAMSIPFFHSLSRALPERSFVKGLALLIPTVILISTTGSLIAAASHLIAIDLLFEIAQEKISYSQWLIYGAPFSLAASLLSMAVIRMLFTGNIGHRKIKMNPGNDVKPLSRKELVTLLTVVAMVLLWLTEHLHGFEIATTALGCALFLTSPGIGILSFKDGLKAVGWNLVLFVGAALVMGKALIKTGAAGWIINALFDLTGFREIDSTLLLLLVLSLISLTAHLYITSHSARAVAVLPSLIYFAMDEGLSPIAVCFIGTIAMDYCLTFPVSSKALLMFHELDERPYTASDLLKLSGILLWVIAFLMVIFYYFYWQFIGLKL